MKVREYLEQYVLWKTKKIHLLSDRDLIVIEEALPPGIDYSSDRVQASPDDGMYKKYLRIQRRTKQIDKEVAELTDKIEHIKAQINDVPDSISSDVLWYRYIEHMNWDQVADKVQYSEDYVKKTLHNKALADFEKIPRNNPF